MPIFNTWMKPASHNAVIYRQDIIAIHQLLFIPVPPLIDYEMITDSHPYLIIAYIDMSTLFLLHTFQTPLVCNICHCSKSHVSCFYSGSSALSHSLPRMTSVASVHPHHLHQCISGLLSQASPSHTRGVSLYTLCMNFFTVCELIEALSCNLPSWTHLCILTTRRLCAWSTAGN